MPPCRFFAAGNCIYGTSCRNAHTFAPPDYTNLPVSESRQNTRQQSPQVSSTNTPVSSKTLCWFFSQGKCRYGTACKTPHDIQPHVGELPLLHQASTTTTLSPASYLRAEEKTLSTETISQMHTLESDTPFETVQVTGGEQSRNQVPCIFFARGFCRNGTECSFFHESLRTVEAVVGREEDNQQQAVSHSPTITKPISNSPRVNYCSRKINGAHVSYGAGAEVSSIKLASDFSIIQIAGLAADANAGTINKLLSDLGHKIDKFTVSFTFSGESGSVAEVRVENPSFAKDVVQRWEQRTQPSNISIKETTGASGSDTTEKRIQLSTVSCTWYQPSRLAWLSYTEEANVKWAIRILGDTKILDRTPSVLYQEVTYTEGEKSSYTLCLGNLHGQTTLRDIRYKLFGTVSPDTITLGDPTYKYSDSEAAQRVRGLLETIGKLDSFQYRLVPGSSKVKATATFFDREAAAEAVRAFHNTHVNFLANTKIFVNHIVSVKYNVPTSIITALKKELDQLAGDFGRSGHVQLKIYPQEDPLKPYTTVRLFWENLKSASGAKVRLEKLLAGVLVKKGEEPLWDTYFLSSAALDDLAELGTTHQMYILRGARKSRLVMYGGSVDAQNEVRQALVKKVEALHEFEHIILLTPQLLQQAVQGGMRRLKSKFGTAVRLNIGVHPSTITITGSGEDFREAQALLGGVPSHSASQASSQSTQDCVICWTEAITPVHTTCGHIYCKECFANQASSATDTDIPLRCFGSEGTCKQIFSFDDLKTMLSPSTFESLLQSSFDSHIRTRPEDFQYCPTPDCPQVYRPTTTGQTFYCATCLTPICTTCNVISHEGMTCEEWKEMDSEDSRAFRQYKEEHDVRDCPNCKVGIEKSEGCNHMECLHCGAHICWFCMTTFTTSGECYAHLTTVHRSIYDENDDERDWDDNEIFD